MAIMMFRCASTLINMSMLLFTLELQIVSTALYVYLSDLETYQDWQQ